MVSLVVAVPNLNRNKFLQQAETNDTFANKANHSSTAANTEDISSDFSLTPSEKEAYEKMKAEQRVRF
jgi:hypothetical protein